MKCNREEGGEGREGRTEAHPPSRNPGYAYEMRSTYDKMTYAYTGYNTLSGKNNVRTAAPCSAGI